MLATVMYGPGDVRVENVPDAGLIEPTDALVRVTHAAICGSDLWPYHLMGADDAPAQMGHEAVGVVEAVGPNVRNVKVGDVVLMPFAISDGTCPFCQEGLPTACVHRSFFGNAEVPGAQAEAVRVPLADGTLFAVPGGLDNALMPSLLTLTDVMGTGHHAAVVARVGPGKTAAVVGDGAVGLCGVLAARRLGAERIILLGRHADRIALARQFGATDIVRDRGEEAIARVRELTGGEGAHSVLECVGTEDAMHTSMGIARPGGAVGRVGVPHYGVIPGAQPMFFSNIIVGGGPAPTRAYMPELLPDVLEGRIEPGKVFDLPLPLREAAEGYRAMDERRSIKALLRP